jgi:hypothetical protein
VLASRIKHHHDAAAIDDARRALAEANLAAYIERTVEAMPPLTSEQTSRLAVLLLRGPSSDTAA